MPDITCPECNGLGRHDKWGFTGNFATCEICEGKGRFEDRRAEQVNPLTAELVKLFREMEALKGAFAERERVIRVLSDQIDALKGERDLLRNEAHRLQVTVDVLEDEELRAIKRADLDADD